MKCATVCYQSAMSGLKPPAAAIAAKLRETNPVTTYIWQMIQKTPIGIPDVAMLVCNYLDLRSLNEELASRLSESFTSRLSIPGRQIGQSYNIYICIGCYRKNSGAELLEGFSIRIGLLGDNIAFTGDFTYSMCFTNASAVWDWLSGDTFEPMHLCTAGLAYHTDSVTERCCERSTIPPLNVIRPRLCEKLCNDLRALAGWMAVRPTSDRQLSYYILQKSRAINQD